MPETVADRLRRLQSERTNWAQERLPEPPDEFDELVMPETPPEQRREMPPPELILPGVNDKPPAPKQAAQRPQLPGDKVRELAAMAKANKPGPRRDLAAANDAKVAAGQQARSQQNAASQAEAQRRQAVQLGAQNRANQQRDEARRRREEARLPTGINARPEDQQAVREQAQARMAATAASPTPPGSPEVRDRLRRSDEVAAEQAYLDAESAWGRKAQQLSDKVNLALAEGDRELAREAAAEQDAHNKQRPKPPEHLRMRFDHDGDPSTPPVEESATQTMDRLKKTDPAAHDALLKAMQRQALSQEAASQRKPFDQARDGAMLTELVEANFGDIPPDERLAAMQDAAARLAPSLAPPTIAETPRAGSVGRGEPQVFPGVVRDPFTGEPVKGGPQVRAATVKDATGRERIAVPNVESEMLNAAGIPNWTQLNFDTDGLTNEQVAALAHNAGINPADYANDPGGAARLEADVRKAYKRAQDRLDHPNVRPVKTQHGVSVVMPTEEAVEARERQKLAEEALKFRANYGSTLDGGNAPMVSSVDSEGNAVQVDILTAIEAAAERGDRKEMRRLMDQARLADKRMRVSALTDIRRRDAEAQLMQDPAGRQGAMLRASLAEAGDDPEARARVYEAFGMPGEAYATRAAAAQASLGEMQARRADAEIGAIEADAAKNAPPPPGPQQMIAVPQTVVQKALDQESGVPPMVLVNSWLEATRPGFFGAERSQDELEAARSAATYELSAAVMNTNPPTWPPIVQQALEIAYRDTRNTGTGWPELWDDADNEARWKAFRELAASAGVVDEDQLLRWYEDRMRRAR